MSSDGSVETAVPASEFKTGAEEEEQQEEMQEHEDESDLPRAPPKPWLQSNPSETSISTMESFATATEGYESDEDVDALLHQQAAESTAVLPQTDIKWPLSPTVNGLKASSMSPRADSAIILSKDAVNGSGRVTPRSPQSPVQILAAHEDTMYPSSPVVASASFDNVSISLNEEDTALVHALATSLQQVCLRLQSIPVDSAERALLRRRVAEARGVLDGETEGEAF